MDFGIGSATMEQNVFVTLPRYRNPGESAQTASTIEQPRS
jgi:hypothetical protein